MLYSECIVGYDDHELFICSSNLHPCMMEMRRGEGRTRQRRGARSSSDYDSIGGGSWIAPSSKM